MKKSARQLDHEIAQALSGKRPASRPRTRVSGRPAHATKAQPGDKGSDKRTIDQLAKMFDLPDWEGVDERNQHYYWEMARGAEDEDAQMAAEQEAQEEVYRKWYDAVERTAEQLLGEHGLGLLAMKHTRKVHQNYRPHVLKIIPTKSWADAADKLRVTISGYGDGQFNSLQEFLDYSGETPRQAVLSNLGYIRHYPEVYGSQSARQLYDQAWS